MDLWIVFLAVMAIFSLVLGVALTKTAQMAEEKVRDMMGSRGVKKLFYCPECEYRWGKGMAESSSKFCPNCGQKLPERK